MQITFIIGFLCHLAFVSAASAETRLVYMHEGEGGKQIFLADENGKNAKPITSGEAWHLYPDLDGAGKQVAYVEGTQEAGLNIVTQDLATGVVTPRTQGPGMRLHPDFSGNGKFLAYSHMPEGSQRAQIEILDLTDTSKKAKVIESEFSGFFPALTSDGELLIYQRTKSKDVKDIVLVRLADGEQKVLTEDQPESMAPTLSFDDRYVAFTQNVANNWDVYRLDLQTGKKIRLTDSPSKDYAPAFRADGSIVFASDRRGHFELFEVPLEMMTAEIPVARLLAGGDGDFYAPSVSGETNFVQGLLPELPDPARSSFGTARVGNKIYIVGGHQGHEHTYPPESFLTEVAYYDVETKVWAKTTPRPAAAHGYGVATRGRYLYAFGGFTYSADHKPKWKSIAQIDRLDTETGEWTTLPIKLNKPRSSNVVAQMGNKVYLIGGWDSTPKKEGDAEGEFLRTIEVFDMKTETLELSPLTLPDPLRRAFTSVVFNDEILLIGGLGVGASHFELLDQVTAFNPFKGTFRELPKLPFATFAPAAGMLGDTLFVFGGMYKTGKMDYNYVNHIHALRMEFDGGAWRNTGRYLDGAKGFAMVVNLDCCGRLGILGGHAYANDTDAPVKTFEHFGWN